MKYLDYKIIKENSDNTEIQITKQKYFYTDFSWAPIGSADLLCSFYSMNGIELVSVPLSETTTFKNDPKNLIVFFHKNNTISALYVFGSSYEYKTFKETIIQIPNEYWPKVKTAIIEYNIIKEAAEKEKVALLKIM